jgi:hypothetical protein
MSDLNPQQRIALIKENLQEVLRLDIIENVIVKEGRPLCIYWGNARLFFRTEYKSWELNNCQEPRPRANRIAATLFP